MDADKKEKLKSILKEVAIQLGHALVTFGVPLLIAYLQKDKALKSQEQNPADTFIK